MTSSLVALLYIGMIGEKVLHAGSDMQRMLQRNTCAAIT